MSVADQRLMRLVLATVWLTTGAVVLFVYPQDDSLALLARVGLQGAAALAALYLGVALDILFGLLTVFVRGKWLWPLQAAIVIAYTLIITVWLPDFWWHPFGPLLKNLPILLLLWLLYKNEEGAR